MRAFCEVVKEGGFSAAARKLGLSKVLVSRYVSALENDLGVRLLQRTTRKMSTTEVGESYYIRCLTLLDDFQDLDDAIKAQHKQVAGKLKLSVPSEAFTNKHLVPFFTKFAQAYPNIELDIQLADRYIDIVEEGFDLAIRIGRLDDSSLIARKLANMKMILCASPEYLTQSASLSHPSDLKQHKLIIDSNFRGGQSWTFTKQSASTTIKVEGPIRINSAAAATGFLKNHIGIGICPSFMIIEELKEGSLVNVMPEWSLSAGGIYAVYSHRRHLSSKINVLVQALVEHFKDL